MEAAEMSNSQNGRKPSHGNDAFVPELMPRDEAGFPADDAQTPYVRHGLAGLRAAREVLPGAALLEALGPAGLRRLRGPGGLAVVVEVPTADWCQHVGSALRDIVPFVHVEVRDGSSKTQHKPSEGNDKVARLLCEGARVAGVSHAPERYLPEALVAAADLVIRIGPPSNRVVAETIRAATGKRARRMPVAVAGSLNFDALTSQIRIGSTPRECIARIRSIAEARSGIDPQLGEVPDLETLHGYGSPAMEWARDLVRDLDAWREGRLDWSAVQRTALLYGPPGTGKTSFVRSVAKAARIPLIATSVSGWFTGSNGYLDGVLKAFEGKLALAAAQAPALLFLDEVDAIPSRDGLSARGRDWWTPVITGVLAALDSTTSGDASRLIVVGATNHLSALDPAMIRPGRLFPPIEIARPSVEDLAGILRQHLGADLPGEDLMPVAMLGTGATGAEAVGWIKAARSAARAEGRRMVVADLARAVAPEDDRTPEELAVCARHEAAHAVAARIRDIGTLRSVSLAMSTGTAGSVRALLHGRTLMTRAQIEDLVIVALAGRAMDASSGAANTGAGGGSGSDLAKATELVASIHATFGLGDELAIRGGPDAAVAAMRDDPALRRVVERDLQALYARAVAFVRDHRPAIEAVAERLVATRVLSGEEVERLIRSHAGTPARSNRNGRARDAR
ncbi:AAA family ATPase [Methylobacterium terricola]|uniref:AAA family ATPase n=2 Tax=Methylobacterium terricola TaxID=2583531 RepID=A0A5C4LFJ9_9HYPH|nr:AAA family ATPase [Methylobacterium terricola]